MVSFDTATKVVILLSSFSHISDHVKLLKGTTKSNLTCIRRSDFERMIDFLFFILVVVLKLQPYFQINTVRLYQAT